MVHQAFVLSLKHGGLEEYIRHHESIRTEHPDLAEALVSSGVKALRIFLDDDRLMLCVEATDTGAMPRLWATSAHRRWSALMDPLIGVGPGGVPQARFLDPVYQFLA